MDKVVAILQARMSSRRLPGKVLLPLLGSPMILRQLERISRAKTLERIIVATSTDTSDDPLEAVLAQRGIHVFRGSLPDVLDRFYHAALKVGSPTHIVRLTGDCPLTDPELIDVIVHHHLLTGADYTSNTIPPTFPDGLDVEVMTFSALKKAHQSATSVTEREHVTPFLYQNSELFKLECVRNRRGDHSALRWTVDEAADFDFVQKVYERLYPISPNFMSDEIYRLIEADPILQSFNKHLKRGVLES